MAIFWVSIEVHLESPITLVSEDGEETRASLSGFVQELGCTATDEAAMRERVLQHVRGYDLGPGQELRVTFQEVDLLERREVEDELAADEARRERLLGDPSIDGIWWATGRSFYSEDSHPPSEE